MTGGVGAGSDDGKILYPNYGGSKHAILSQVCSVSSSVSFGAMHHKGLHDTGPRVSSPTYSTVSDSYGHEEEELRYGPGIVSKLKNRYMSLAMRETRSRPSLRKFSSLEDLLDSEPRDTWQESGIIVSKPRVTQDPSASSHRREVMRRARSVDSLSSRLAEDSTRGGGGGGGGGAATRTSRMPKSKSASSRLQSSLNPLAKDDVIIIETSKPQEQKAMNGSARAALGGGEPPPLSRNLSTSSSQAEEEDMPPPDTVRQVKRIFEAVGDKPVRGTAAKVAAHKASHGSKSNGLAHASKPALKAKPTNVPPRKVTPPAGPAQHITIEEAKLSLRKVAQSNRPSPRTTLSVRATANTAVNGEKTSSKKSDKESSSSARVRPGLTPVTSSVTAPLVNGGDPVGRQALSESEQCVSAVQAEEGVRRVSSTAVHNIRKESQSQEYNFVSGSVSLASGGEVAPLSTPKPSSPTPSPLPSSPVASHRVPSHSPFGTPVERAQENDRVQQENLKNVEKSRSLLPAVESPKTEVLTPSKADLSKQAKVDTSKPGPKVELFKSSPQVEHKHSTPKKVEPKTEVRTPPPSVKTETVKPTPSSPAEELVRSPGRGSLVEAVNTSNKQALLNSPGSTPITTKTASSRDRWHQQENTIVFNFTGTKKETPDYIENDGIDLSRRRPEVSTESYT